MADETDKSNVVPAGVGDRSKDDQLVYDEIVRTSEIAIETSDSGEGIVVDLDDRDTDIPVDSTDSIPARTLS